MQQLPPHQMSQQRRLAEQETKKRLSAPDPHCICRSDLQAVPQNVFHRSDAAFALESLRLLLQTRNGAHTNILDREYVLFKSFRHPPISKLSLAAVRTKPQEQQDQGQQLLQQQRQMMNNNNNNNSNNFSGRGINATASAAAYPATTLWQAVQKSFPLFGVVSQTPISLIEAFSIARFGSTSQAGRVYQSLCDKFAVKDPNAKTAQDLVPLPTTTTTASSSSSFSHNNSATMNSSDFFAPTATGADFGPNSASASAFSAGTFGSHQFTPKLRKKAPLSRVLRHLAKQFNCHIFVSARTSIDDEEDTVAHFAPPPPAPTSTSASQEQSSSSFTTPRGGGNQGTSASAAASDLNPRIVILRPVGDVVIRQSTKPNEEGVFVWSALSASWHCAFVDKRIMTSEFASPSALRRGGGGSSRRKRDQNVTFSPTATPHGVVESDHDDDEEEEEEEEESESDDENDHHTISMMSRSTKRGGDNNNTTNSSSSSDDSDSDSDADTLSENSEDLDTFYDNVEAYKSRRRQLSQHEMSTVVDPRWTSNLPYKGKFVQSYFNDGGGLNNTYNNNNNTNTNASQFGNQSNFSTMRKTVMKDLIATDNFTAGASTFVVEQEPPLANINYPTLDGSIGFGLLLKATVGSDSPLFSRMRTRFFAIIVLCLLTIIFSCGYLGATVPSIDFCCIPANFTGGNSSTSREIVQAYSMLFCPVQKAVFEQIALTLPSGGPLNATAAPNSTSNFTNITTALACAQRVCASDQSVRDGALAAAKYGDAAGGPVEVASTFLFATIGPAIVIFVMCIVLILLELMLAFLIARRLAIKSHGMFTTALYVFNILIAMFIAGEGAALVQVSRNYKYDATEHMTQRTDCNLLPDSNSRQICHTANDCGVELRSRVDMPSDTMLGLAAMLLVFGLILLIAAAALYPFPSEADEQRILPSRPSTLMFHPGRAAPDGMPVDKLVRLQHRIAARVQYRVDKDVERKKRMEERTKHQRVYGGANAAPPPREIPGIAEQKKKQEEQEQEETGGGGASGRGAAVSIEQQQALQQRALPLDDVVAGAAAGGGGSQQVTPRTVILSGEGGAQLARIRPRIGDAQERALALGDNRPNPVNVFVPSSSAASHHPVEHGQVTEKLRQQQKQHEEEERELAAAGFTRSGRGGKRKASPTSGAAAAQSSNNNAMDPKLLARINKIATRVNREKEMQEHLGGGGVSDSVAATAAAGGGVITHQQMTPPVVLRGSAQSDQQQQQQATTPSWAYKSTASNQQLDSIAGRLRPNSPS